jgi:uncharacterized protein (TIGR00288 family)
METRQNNGLQIAVFMDFENIATSAEATIGDFDVNAIMELLRTRGRLLIKRAYGDWGRYQRYRRDMLESGIDLFQLYTVGVQQKNRADVRLAIDAMETVFTRPNIDLYAVVSGDSDFTELIHKLRDHGKYTIGIGLRAATSDLLRRACDEFIFYETLVSEELDDISDELRLPDARDLLRRALGVAEQKGEVPVFAGRLKQIMLGIDPSFNEANYGFQQFRAFLDAHQDLVTIEEQGLQVYVGLHRPAALAAAPGVIPPPVHPAADQAQRENSQGQRYRSFLREASLRLVERGTRLQVLRDFLTLVQAHPDSISLTTTADLLKDRYDSENAMTPKIAVPEMLRLLIMSEALEFAGGHASSYAPLKRLTELNLEALAMACDAVYVWRLVEGGVPVFADQLAPVLYGADVDAAPVAALCQALIDRERIVASGGSYAVSAPQINRLLAKDELQLAVADMARVALPTAAGEPLSPSTANHAGSANATGPAYDAGVRSTGARTAENLFREASELRQRDFAGSALRYLQAARIQLDALRETIGVAKAGQSRPGFDDLKWYLASYCSVKAGHAFVTGDYDEAEPYYLAFFGLAQEADGVWPRIQRLVNPMESYFCALAGKQLGENVPPNLGRSPAGQVALQVHNHPQQAVGARWEELIERLAAVNLGLVRQAHRDLIAMIKPGLHSGSEDAARIERTRAFLADLIARRESESK